MKENLKTESGLRRWLRCLVLLWARVRGNHRIRWNQCPACNSDAPEVDTCPVCEGYDYKPHHTEYPPANWRKADWRNRYGSYLEYLYVENPPRLKWDGEKWVEVVEAGKTTAELAGNWERAGFGSVAEHLKQNGGGDVGPPEAGPLPTTLLPGRDRTI